jgi:hypothetical protein
MRTWAGDDELHAQSRQQLLVAGRNAQGVSLHISL